ASHPLFRGAMTRMQEPIRKVLEQYDVLFSVGGDLFTLSLPSAIHPMPDYRALVHVDNDPWELGKNYPPKVAILGDPKATLPEITKALRERMTAGERAAARERLDAAKAATLAEREALMAKAHARANAPPLQPLSLLAAIGGMLPNDAVVIDETISSGPGLRSLLRSDDPQSFYGLRGGGIGWGLPAALGVKLALPERPVVALVGDGSAMYTCQALWTAAHDKIAVVFVILNNTSYRILKQRLRAQRGAAAQVDRYVGMELVDPAIDYVGLARSLGIAAERAKTVHETTDLIAQGLKSGAPLLIDVPIDRALR